ncbi:DNA polymerase III subunit delta' [Salinisphaera japonica]|uniref:DNA-directed DNA polymerase n=1 Tax=Salinisphaera japonica YTM-1 TaxID=1209778 RepID=A0A423Q242_9GAMM|nr:DNA polymerase III subunit delta' [Salinisphaera japonica]ROO32679.1 DNA polymerase III subunit delta' [Salinisphaera japonica YTM-1]
MSDTSLDPRLPWHDAMWAPMRRALGDARVAHGLLVCGPPGIGKRVFAERVVAALLCRAPDDNRDACGRCAACRQRLAATHPDISRLVPEDTGKKIKVEQVRRFAHALHLTPQYDAGRIGWIDPADALTPSAANSLLKTLEEPPAGCHILLVTDRLSALLPTIRSRCQLWRLPAAEPDMARAWLEAQGIAHDQESSDRLRAPMLLTRAEAGEARGRQQAWDADLCKLLQRRANPITVAERAADADRAAWTAWLYRRTNDLMSLAVGAAPATGLDPAAEDVARRLGAAHLSAWSQSVTTVGRRVDTNADWQLTLEALFIDLGQRVAGISSA